MPRKKEEEVKFEEPKVEEKPAEPVQPVEEKKDWGAAAKKALKIIIGIIIALAGVYVCIWRWIHLWPFLQAVAGPFIIMVGLIVILLGWTD